MSRESDKNRSHIMALKSRIVSLEEKLKEEAKSRIERDDTIQKVVGTIFGLLEQKYPGEFEQFIKTGKAKTTTTQSGLIIPG